MNTGRESKTIGTTKPETPSEKQSITTLYTPEQRGQLALSSELQAAAVMQGFQKNVMGGDVDLETLEIGRAHV